MTGQLFCIAMQNRLLQITLHFLEGLIDPMPDQTDMTPDSEVVQELTVLLFLAVSAVMQQPPPMSQILSQQSAGQNL